MRIRFLPLLTATITTAVLGACGGGGGDVVNPPGGGVTGSFAVTLSTPTLTLAPGATQTIVVTASRTGGFTGVVTLTATPLPANVTASFTPASLASGVTTSTMTLIASAAAVNGVSAITVTGTATGISNQSAGLQFTIATPVQGAASFSIKPSVTAFVSPPAATLVHIPTIGITRDAGYTGAITFSVTGLPPTVAAVVTPAVATGNSVSLPIINAGAPNGTYTATIRAVGASGGGERTATVQVVVGPATTGNVTWRVCSSAPRYPSYFVAVKDGATAWSRVVPGNDGTTYTFNVTQPTASVAWVTLDSGVARTTVYNATQAEITALAGSDCTLYPSGSTRNAVGTVTGLTASQQSLLGMGWWFGSTINPSSGTVSNYSLLNLPSGPLDLIAFRAATDGTLQTTTDRSIIRRGLNPATGGSNTPIDFNSAEAIATTASTWTVNNASGESFGMTETFTTVGGSSGQMTPGPGIDRAPATRTIYGVPLAQTVVGDLHQVVFTIGTLTPRHASRQIIAYARTIADRTVAFGPVMPTPTISSVSVTGAAMLRAQGTVPTEYNSGITLDAKSTGAFARFATVHATRGFLSGSGTYDVRMPDLTQVLGWDTTWSLRPGDATNWWVSGGGPILDYYDARFIFASTQRAWTGMLPGITAPADGNTFLIGRASGTITP
jgi:hypothetical protein